MTGYSKCYCRDCDIWVHDEETLRNHRIGKPHLKQLQRVKEDKARKLLPNYDSSNRTGMNYYELPSQYTERINQFNKQNDYVRDERKRNHSSSDEEKHRRNGYSDDRERRLRSRSRSPSRRKYRNKSSNERVNGRDYGRRENRQRPGSNDSQGSGTSSSDEEKRRKNGYIDNRERKRISNSRSPSKRRCRNESSNDSGRDYVRQRENGEKQSRNQESERASTSSSAYPVIPASNANNEFRPKLEMDIKKVNGQYYCDPCDTYCARMDIMTAHLSGKSHKKKTKQITRYACDLCLIEVSSAETLQTHYQGMSHIKRAKVAEEAKKESDYCDNYQPENMKEELTDLRQRCQKLERQNANLQKEVDHLIKFKRNCTENHQRIKDEDVRKFEPLYGGVVLE